MTLSIYLPKDFTALFKYKVVFVSMAQTLIHRTYEKLRETNEVERAIFVGFHYEDVDKEGQNFIRKALVHH